MYIILFTNSLSKFKAKAISGPAASTDYSLYEIETIDIVDSSAKAGNERGFQIKLAGSDITIRSNARAIEISSSTPETGKDCFSALVIKEINQLGA